MKTVDKINISLIIITTLIYIILCWQTKYRSIFDNNYTLTESENSLLYFTTVYGFIYGTILAAFQQRYIGKNIKDIWLAIFILFTSVLLIFSAFYSQIFIIEDSNSFLGKFSYAMVPILPSLVVISEVSISQILEYNMHIESYESDSDNSFFNMFND
jgi:peptidoglycan/LPS O-acetylase OafA/YrhL